jgi:hypothetical protein
VIFGVTPKAPHDPTDWAVLHSVIGDDRIPAALRSRFIEVLQTVSFDELARADTKMLGMALIFACDQAASHQR